MSERDAKYFMTISLNVLNHMGLNLYSNTPAVLAEVIANSWDADATEVSIDFDLEKKSITVTDNGCGMTRKDVNGKYLYVGYEKRPQDPAQGEKFLTPAQGRQPMGRKGIGKLSLFSIANEIRVFTQVSNGEPQAFLMDADKIRAAISIEDPSKVDRYEPQEIAAYEDVPKPHGTCIQITQLKKIRLTEASVTALRRRIARRFSILGASHNFTVSINNQQVTLSDREYFHKARFIFQYGGNYAEHCSNLERDESDEVTGRFDRPYRFDASGKSCEDGEYSIRGWIAIAWRSNDLDGGSATDSDNLNRITIIVRGKVAQEDILQEFRLGGMITKYMFGEMEADFLDQDDQPDIATSSRQRIAEDDERYRALVTFMLAELKSIWSQTNKLKEDAGIRYALATNPHLRKWHDSLTPRLKNFAKKIFGDIDKANIDEAERQRAYANGILLFEHLKMNHAIDLLRDIDVTSVDQFLDYLREVDALEVEQYRQIVDERLSVIRKLREIVDENAKERILQEYVFEHLYLLDPGWERATQFEDMEKRMERVLGDMRRIDIHYVKYRRVAAAHVIVELKRSSASTTKTDLESQVRGYMDRLRNELAKGGGDSAALPIEAVCVVGNLPRGWERKDQRSIDEQSLALYKIRVVTYDELIDNAYAAYGKFLEAWNVQGELRQLIEQIRDYKPNSSS